MDWTKKQHQAHPESQGHKGIWTILIHQVATRNFRIGFKISEPPSCPACRVRKAISRAKEAVKALQTCSDDISALIHWGYGKPNGAIGEAQQNWQFYERFSIAVFNYQRVRPE